jgi:hypothetical protein
MPSEEEEEDTDSDTEGKKDDPELHQSEPDDSDDEPRRGLYEKGRRRH